MNTGYGLLDRGAGCFDGGTLIEPKGYRARMRSMRLEARGRTRLAKDAKLAYGVCSTERSLTSIPGNLEAEAESRRDAVPPARTSLENHRSDKLTN